jgi:hypothetical protein
LAQPEIAEGVQCPNPKCGKPLPSNHSDPWCHHCGEYFPDDIAAKLPQLVAFRAARNRPALHDSVGKAMENATPRARAVMGRYRDAYRVANVIISAGNTIKGIGLVLAVIIALLALITASKVGILALFAGVIPAATIGLLSWLSGVLLTSQGQLLLASLDGVVGASPFLTDDEKSEAMSLP